MGGVVGVCVCNRTTDKGRSMVLLGWNYGTVLHIVSQQHERVDRDNLELV